MQHWNTFGVNEWHKNHTYAQNRSDWVFPYATMRNNLIQADGVASLQLIELYAYSHLSCLSCWPFYDLFQAKSLVLAALVGSAAAFAPISNLNAARSVTSLNEGDVAERVRELVKTQLNVEGDFEDSAAFIADLEADSLDAVELIMGLEEEFDIEIPDEEVEGITTVQAAIDFVTKAQA